jgi:hypothetical protein
LLIGAVVQWDLLDSKELDPTGRRRRTHGRGDGGGGDVEIHRGSGGVQSCGGMRGTKGDE